MGEPKERRAPHRATLGVSIASALLLLAGPSVGFLLAEVTLGVMLFALGGILLALRGYLETGDKVVAGALFFIALVAIGMAAVVYLLGP
jgi:peptidoglycan/LPS O-acetylase OafA/YrhL